VKYLFACFFGLLGLLPLSRALSGLRSGEVDVKLYLPLAKRSERPALYWTFICINISLAAISAGLGLLVLSRLR
jgi:hypothetical protein